MPGNNSGRRQPGNSAVPSTVGRLGVDGFWVGDYGGGGPGRPPCWRTLEESCKGLGSVSLKINNQHTHTPRVAGSLPGATAKTDCSDSRYAMLHQPLPRTRRRAAPAVGACHP